MSTLSIYSRISGKLKRFKLDDIKDNCEVGECRLRVSKEVNIPSHEIELLYCGQCLRDGKVLSDYSIQSGSIVHALKKAASDDIMQVADPLDSISVQQVVTALQAALINPAYRNTVEKMLKDPEALENIIAASPGLDNDPIAMAILQDAELLAILADPSHIHKVIEAHPSLGHAAMLVAAAVNEDGASGGGGSAASSGLGSYSLDQMSDDEDMDSVQPRPGGATAGQITASQLAAAFAAVSGGTPSNSPLRPQQSSSQSSSQPLISADFFQQALSQVASGSGSSASLASGSSSLGNVLPSSSFTNTSQAPPEDVILSQLAQLRDMGISDEAAARQALMVTGGDLQAALEILFSG